MSPTWPVRPSAAWPALRGLRDMNRIFIDMDGVSVDYDRYVLESGLDRTTVKRTPGSYLKMKPYPGAIEGIRLLLSMGYECWIGTRPPTGVPSAYSEKAQWIIEYLPELANRVIVTPDKGLLGDAGDYLLDDQPHKANCAAFPGRVLHFGPGTTWIDVLMFFRRENRKRTRDQA